MVPCSLHPGHASLSRRVPAETPACSDQSMRRNKVLRRRRHADAGAPVRSCCYSDAAAHLDDPRSLPYSMTGPRSGGAKTLPAWLPSTFHPRASVAALSCYRRVPAVARPRPTAPPLTTTASSGNLRQRGHLAAAPCLRHSAPEPENTKSHGFQVKS